MKAYQSSPASGNGWSRVIGVDQQRELGQFLLGLLREPYPALGHVEQHSLRRGGFVRFARQPFQLPR